MTIFVSWLENEDTSIVCVVLSSIIWGEGVDMHGNQGQKISSVWPQDKFPVSKPIKQSRSDMQKAHKQHSLRPQLQCDLKGLLPLLKG